MAKRDREQETERTEAAQPIELNPQLETEAEADPAPPSGKQPTPFQIAKQKTAELKAQIRALPKEENRQDQPAPICPSCNVKTESKGSDPIWTWYYCPYFNKGCASQFRQQVMRPGAREILMKGRQRPDEPFAAR